MRYNDAVKTCVPKITIRRSKNVMQCITQTVSSQLLDFFTPYQTDRKLRVVVEGVESEWIDALSGVPRGTVPLLYLIFNNDMPKVVGASKFDYVTRKKNILDFIHTINTSSIGIMYEGSWCLL